MKKICRNCDEAEIFIDHEFDVFKCKITGKTTSGCSSCEHWKNEKGEITNEKIND